MARDAARDPARDGGDRLASGASSARLRGRTAREAARAWGVSLSLIHKWIRQQRVRVERVGGSSRRAGRLYVLDGLPPAPLGPGGLTAAQRAAWPRG